MRVKRLLCSLLALCMVLSTMGTVAFANNAEADVWDGTVDTSWYNDTDTEFTITTAEQWAGLAQLVNDAESYSPAMGNEDTADFGWYCGKQASPDDTANGIDFKGVTIKLAADLDLRAVYENGDPVLLPGGENLSMAPVGYSTYTPFKGTFDGQGHTIKNLFQGGWDMYKYADSGDGVYLGLFGVVEDATIKNLIIDNFAFNCEMNLGAAAGISGGNSTFDGITIKNSTIATGGGWWVGGLIGWAYGNQTIQNINIDETNTIAQVGGHYDTAVGGIIGGCNNVDGESIAFKDCNVACKLDVYNDCTANYDTNSYRNCGMLIGGIGEGNEIIIDGKKYPDFEAKGLTFDNVNVTFGEWANYTYCWSTALLNNCQRIEPGVGYKGVDFSKISDYSIDTSRSFDAIFGAENAGDLNNIRGKVDVNVMVFLEEKLATSTNKVDFSGIAVTDTVLEASSEAKIGNIYYATIENAIATAKDGDTIKILAGTYDAFEVPADKNNLTFVGETGSTGLSRSVENLVTIKTLDTGIESHNGGIFVGAENTTFKNLNFTAGTNPGARSGWMSSSLGNTNGDTGMSSSLKNLTVENCNFTGSGAYQAIWTNQGNITLKNTTITNYNNGVDNYAIGADQKVVIENSEITDVYNAFHTGEAADGAQIVVTETDIDSEVINIGGSVAVTVEESTIKNAAVTTYASSTFAVSESALYDTTYAVDANATGSITLDAVYVNNVNELAANAKADNIAFNTYYPEAKDLGTGNTVAVPAATDAIYVKFENVTDADAEGEMTYNINLVATDTEIINRLNSADLTFAFDATEGDVAYEIIASNSEVAVNPVDNSKVRYEFHYNGKDGVTTDSANKITIGQVRFEGYGKFDFTVDAAVDTNTAHATTVADNIVDTFIPNGDAATVANGELVIDDTTITDVVIAVPDRNLTISIDFPNAVENKAIAYQDMKVVISGGDLEKDITIDLGNDAVETALDIFGKEDAKFAAAMDNNGSYVINVTDALTLNNAYTVTVSGAGYRTARYTVTMTEDKALRFWNNVMDENQVVELGKDSSIAKVTFLAGDIVKDNNINIYDLSAVVSYFGSVSTTENGYAKYDLNRDGVIDSKDVAYVLVSWNN